MTGESGPAHNTLYIKLKNKFYLNIQPLEEFRTSIFEKSKEKRRKRLIYNFGIFGVIGVIWILYFIGFPFIGLKTSVVFSIVMLGIKVYDDKYMGISAYGDRKANLVIAEQYLEIRDIKIPYADLTNLVIYVEEYLGMPREIYGIHHGGNNKIEFDHGGKSVSINYVIKNKQDYESVSRLVDKIEKDPSLKKNLRKL
jgi:hypothetical protein